MFDLTEEKASKDAYSYCFKDYSLNEINLLKEKTL